MLIMPSTIVVTPAVYILSGMLLGLCRFMSMYLPPSIIKNMPAINKVAIDNLFSTYSKFIAMLMNYA